MALTFYEVETNGCERCNTTQPSQNVMSPYERLVLGFDFEFCPYCGRYLNREDYAKTHGIRSFNTIPRMSIK